MSSAETLRLAAEKMREDAGFDYYADGAFLEAVADWLSLQAERLDGASEGMVIQDHPALRIARAYLGPDAIRI